MGEQTQNRQWRRYSFTILPDSDYELVFPDSSPNQGLVRNLSAGGNIFVGIDGYVNELNYEFTVEPNSSTIIGKAISFNRIYLHNPNSESINVVVDSTFGEFDLSLLKEFKVNLSGEVAEEIRYNGIINGFTVPLPAGTNNIGDVDVLTLPSLPAGTNNIGDVDVLTLPSLPAGTNNIGDVDVVSLPELPTGDNVIGRIKMERSTDYHYREYTLTPLESDEQNYVFSEIVMLSNDGINDLKVKFKNSINIYGSEITLKPSEVINFTLGGNGYTVYSEYGTEYRILLNGGI
jgi:hypothetical protein